jgi:hypothetical protein
MPKAPHTRGSRAMRRRGHEPPPGNPRTRPSTLRPGFPENPCGPMCPTHGASRNERKVWYGANLLIDLLTGLPIVSVEGREGPVGDRDLREEWGACCDTARRRRDCVLSTIAEESCARATSSGALSARHGAGRATTRVLRRNDPPRPSTRCAPSSCTDLHRLARPLGARVSARAGDARGGTSSHPATGSGYSMSKAIRSSRRARRGVGCGLRTTMAPPAGRRY